MEKKLTQEDFKKDFPKTFEKAKDFIKNLLMQDLSTEQQAEVAEQIIQSDEFLDDITIQTFFFNMSAMTDFFESIGIYIGINFYIIKDTKKVEYTYNVEDISQDETINAPDSETFKTRAEANQAALSKAIQMFENK